MTTPSMLRLLMIASAACNFTPGAAPGTTGDDAPRMIDGPLVLVDASECTMASAECANADTLRTCSGPGAMAVDVDCQWGCLTTSAVTSTPHCGAIYPSGGAVVPTDLDPTMLVDVALNGTIDTGNGSISGTFTRSSGVGPMDGVDYKVVNSVAIFRFKSLHVTGPVGIGGPFPIALVSDGDITIDGAVDGAGSSSGAAGPGGYSGGTKQGGPGGGGGGGSGGLGTDPNNCGGGGGGGYGGGGGAGGSGGNAGGSAGGSPAGDPTIANLIGGAGGGGGGGAGGAAVGGGGGGGIQLVSNGTIMINGGGTITAGGAGGPGSPDGGGGGGAGGTILVEAPTITISGTLAVNGGGGGASGNGTAATNSGAKGGTSRTPATGGTGGTDGAGGGSGGAAASLGGTAGGNGNKKGAGGGGAIGRMRFNTKSGTINLVAGSVMSPSLNDMPTTATQAVATVK